MLDFNHAMLYVGDLDRSVAFYEALGLSVVDRYDGGYARLRFPGGSGSLALHVEDGRDTATPGSRLYFEVEEIERFCRDLEAHGISFSDPLARRAWGWDHAYLLDPDGHEISLYRAGSERLDPARH
jgi:catechol 2,3-dioxygenase-like lactoylglutathione lyase family enzyme